MSLQSNEAKREEFHRYLEKGGVMDSLTRVLVALYELPEKPLNANEFLRDFLSVAALDEVENLRQQLTEQKNQLNQKDKEIVSLREEIEQLKAQMDGRYADDKDRDYAPSFQYAAADENVQPAEGQDTETPTSPAA